MPIIKCCVCFLILGVATVPVVAQDKSTARPHGQSLTRRHLADYSAALELPNGRVDTDAMVKRLHELGVNTYYWLVAPWSSWDDLKLFLPKAGKAGIDVWVYLVPPSESPPGGVQPFRLDYVAWGEGIARLSLEHPNVTAWVIDDFYGNRKFFTPAYLREIRARSQAVNPRLAFLPLMYFPELLPKFLEDYRSVIDGAVVAYLQDRDEIERTWAFFNDCDVLPASEFICPPSTPTRPGDYVMASQPVRVLPGTVHQIRFLDRDGYSGPTAGYHFKQLLVDGKVAWEEDVAGKPDGPQEVVVDVTDLARGKTSLTVAFRLLEKKGVGNFSLNWSVKELRGTNLQLAEDTSRAEKWKVSRQGPFQTGFGARPKPGRHRFHIPFISMTAAQPIEFRMRHGDPATPERIAGQLRLSLDAWRDGKCDGVVTYCLDKRANSPEFPAVQKLFQAANKVAMPAAAAGQAFAQNVAQNPGVPWPATDALGRSLPTQSQVGPLRPDRTVAMFYFLWHEAGYPGPFDVTKILAADPAARHKATSPPWGPLYAPHHWGESIFGYYLGDDEAVLRKHAQMLADAGVDVIVFDASNKATYPHNYLKLFEVFRRVRQEGNRTPQVAFLTPFGDPRSTVRDLYEHIYARRLYEELWFRWDGKPLILADPARVDRALRPFFTFRKPQPDYFRGPTGPDMWSWLEVFPQHVFKNSRGEKEQMSVGAAQNAIGNRLGTMSEPGARGRSFHGNNYAEQWERAIHEDPRLVFITGWNEWIAGRFDEFIGVKMPPMFVDEFDEEHSRDIEPMKGGHGDNYYWQTVSFIRRYKGALPLPPSVTPSGSPHTIAIDGRFDDWNRVRPEYADTVGDPVHRHHNGWGKAGPYINETGRNDIVSAKVSCDATHVFFYVRTKARLTPPTDPNWMLLLVDSDADARTGWLGYDLVIRPGVTADAPFKAAGNELELVLPRRLVHDTFDFKWCDNIAPYGDAVRFTLDGDAAPNDRFNYRAELPVSGKTAR